MCIRDRDTTQFSSIERIKNYIPVDKKSCIILAMADVQQVTPEHITPYTGDSIEGIRIVFYKHQIESAIALAKVVKENGYKLFMQPMVTIDYSVDEYAKLTKEIAKIQPYAVSIVDLSRIHISYTVLR